MGAEAKNHLRPHHHHAASLTQTQKVRKLTKSPAAASQEPPAVKELEADLAEVKQMHQNVAAVERTLTADVALLRETASLQRMSGSAQARNAANVQLHQAEQLVKATEAMVIKSRGDAEDRAKAALQEATEVQ